MGERVVESSPSCEGLLVVFIVWSLLNISTGDWVKLSTVNARIASSHFMCFLNAGCTSAFESEFDAAELEEAAETELRVDKPRAVAEFGVKSLLRMCRKRALRAKQIVSSMSRKWCAPCS